jgi:hypothetical protein
MKLMVLTCSVYPESEYRKKLRIFIKSCEKYGIEPHFYGVGQPWTIYRHIKLEMQLEYLKEHGQSFTHVLYTDGQDALFTAGLDEIVAKYEAMGSPSILTSAYTGFADTSAPEGFGTERLRYPHVGGHLSEIPAIIDAFERMLKLPNQTSDDSFNWRDAWLEGWFRPAIDSTCQIFQVTDEHCVVANLEDYRPEYEQAGALDSFQPKRLFNTHTKTTPCILHLSGGYTDPETGKDAAMIPWAKKLGVIE